MTLIPQRTVASQIAAQLRANIENRTWQGWLPTERSLCQLVEASRNTVRRAINQLKAEGLVESAKPRGNRIMLRVHRPRRNTAPKSVGLLVPEAVHHLRPFTSLWMEELRNMLIEEGHPVRLHTGQQYYRTHPTAALERLTTQHSHDAWVLVLSSKAMQHWFQRRKLRCLVAGSIYADIQLPFFDLDYGAICRHAVATLRRLGHRHIAFLNHTSLRAGEQASETAFAKAVSHPPRSDLISEIVHHGDDVDTVGRALASLRRKKPGFPTALVVNSSSAYLATVSWLAHWRLRVPEDVSLICRDDDPLLNHLYPAPARYLVSPDAFARKLIGPILQLVRGLPVPQIQNYYLPRFHAGGSVHSSP